MEFINTTETEVTPLLNPANLIYKSDIDIKILDGTTIVGFIITTVSPVRFVGVLDFGCASEAFEEYRIDQYLTSLTFNYNEDTQTTPPILADDAVSLRPYISNTSNIVLFQGTTSDIEINGDNFDSNIIFDLGPEVTFNSITSITPNSVIINVTASPSNLQNAVDILLTRGGVSHFGDTPKVTVTDVVIGDGPSGTYTTNFNSSGGNNGTAAFDGNWDLAIEGPINALDTFFVTSNAGTPSSGTGPSSAYDSYYLFTERSNPNNGVGANGYIETSYFHELTQISFYYHMYGTTIQDLVLESKDIDGLWHERWRRTGQQQSAQGDPFISSGNIDTTSWDATAIRFKFEDNGGSYTNDIAIDEIVITSI